MVVMLSVEMGIGGSHDMLGDLVDSAGVVVIDSHLRVGNLWVHESSSVNLGGK